MVGAATLVGWVGKAAKEGAKGVEEMMGVEGLKSHKRIQCSRIRNWSRVPCTYNPISPSTHMTSSRMW